jgi:hypothetical protein
VAGHDGVAVVVKVRRMLPPLPALLRVLGSCWRCTCDTGAAMGRTRCGCCWGEFACSSVLPCGWHRMLRRWAQG